MALVDSMASILILVIPILWLDADPLALERILMLI